MQYKLIQSEGLSVLRHIIVKQFKTAYSLFSIIWNKTIGEKPSVETSSDLKLNRIKNLQWEVVQSGNNSDPETDGPFQNTLFNGVGQEIKLKLKLLLNNTPSVYETNCSIRALHTACKNGDLNAVRLLLKSGAPVNAPRRIRSDTFTFDERSDVTKYDNR